MLRNQLILKTGEAENGKERNKLPALTVEATTQEFQLKISAQKMLQLEYNHFATVNEKWVQSGA